MLERIITFFGIIIGIGLIGFGIVWPDKYSNAYLYNIALMEADIKAMQEARTPFAQVQAKRRELETYRESIPANVARFLDLKSFVIVFGGSFAALLIAFPARKSLRAFLFISSAFFGKDKQGSEFAEYYSTFVKFSEKLSARELITDEDFASIEDKRLREWLEYFTASDSVPEEMIQEIIRSEIAAVERTSEEEAELLDFMSKVAPAFGMIGTVIGLILMLGNVNADDIDIFKIIGAMGVAMITTLYGVAVANLIFTPIATKRRSLMYSELYLMEMAREGILYLKNKQTPELVSRDLIIYLPDRIRQRIEQEKLEKLKSGDLGL